MYAETSDIENVMIAGKFVKAQRQADVSGSAAGEAEPGNPRVAAAHDEGGKFRLPPVPSGPLPERYVF
jgi:hypothetical protein